MKNILYTFSVIALGLLSSCYDSEYPDKQLNFVGTLATSPVKINDSNNTLTLSAETWDYSYLHFQLSRTSDFSSGETLVLKGKEVELGKLNQTYYYRAIMVSQNDTIYAPNVESFSVDNTLSLSSPQPITDISYRLVCNTPYMETVTFRVSNDIDFKDNRDYQVYNAKTIQNDGAKPSYEYSLTLDNLARGTTYYVKAIREVLLGTVESDVVTFTTADFLKMGEVTYTGWDGKTYPMTEGYDHFFANYAINGQVTDRNLEIYRTENGWTLSKDITPTGNSVLYGFYSYDMQNSDNAIEIQTYKYDNPTLMWGVAEEDKGVFNINLRNMLARVVFHLTVSDDYPVDKPEVGEFTISGNTLPTIASFQVNTGTFTYNQWSFSEPLGYWNRIGLCKGETVDLVLYSIPSSDPGKGTVSMNFINDNFDSEIEIDWRTGNTYEYNLNVTAAGLSISDVIVNEWQPTDGGSIIINPNK